jgi:hypothetical protein
LNRHFTKRKFGMADESKKIESRKVYINVILDSSIYPMDLQILKF